MVATLSAQFLTAFADNGLLFAALALVRKDAYPSWSGPLLQEFFVGTYILLAPFVGEFADVWPKGRVMVGANAVKFLGALGMCLDVNPFLSYAFVGIGAATYSPAKYGILSELTQPQHLVKANGLIEGATVAGILLGAIGGGALTDWSIEGAMTTVAVCYAAAAASALIIPPLRSTATSSAFSLRGSLATFAHQTAHLLRNRDALLALSGTALFWGVGASLRFLLIAWVPIALHITNNRLPAFLTAMVAAGLVIGAALAARFVRLEVVHRALPAGVLIGAGVCLLPLVTTQFHAYLLMAFVGVCSGFFVVPLNALLQHQEDGQIGVGAAIAIQNFFENFSMLALVTGYTTASYLHVPVDITAFFFGALIALAMVGLIVMRNT